MSAQNAKRKRVGSRRRVINQNKTSEADELDTTDSTSVAQHCITEETTESLNVLANPVSSQSETQNPPLPEHTGFRRKLGSSRRNKSGQYVEDTVTESYHRPREEVEEQTWGNDTTETTQMSHAKQPKRQEELSQESEHDIVPATHDGSLYSATIPDDSPEGHNTTTTNCPEADLESKIPRRKNLQADQDENKADCKVVSDSCKLVETVLEGADKSDTLQTEEVRENAHVIGISELTTLSVLLVPTVDQQLIDQSNCGEMPEELSNVYSVTEKESKDKDEDTEMLRQEGHLQGNYLVSESHVESVVMQFSTTPEITTDRTSPREHTEIECSVEQAELSSPQKELSKDVKGAQHSEDAINKMHEQEIRPTQMQEMPQIDYFSENVTQDATENSEIMSGNLLDQAEVTDTYQSEMTEKPTDDSASKEEDSNLGNKQDEHPTKENNHEALGHRNEDYHDTQDPHISDIEGADTALGQVYESEGRVEDDIKPSAEQIIHQEKEEILPEVEESESILQSLQSETHAPLDSHLQDISVITEEKTHKGFNPTENRRKFGSSRRNKGRQQVKDSAAESYHEHEEEVVESTRTNEALETPQMLLPIEGQSQEELSQGSERDITMPATHESSLYSALMPGYSSEVQNPTTTNYPEADLGSLILKCEKLQEEYDEGETDFKMEVSDKSVGATLEEMDKSDTLQSQEVRGAHHSEDAINKVNEQEIKPTQMQEMPQIDYFSESVTHDATENSEIISGNLLDQAEVTDTYQSEMIGKSTDDSASKREDSNPGNKQDEHPMEENYSETLDHRNEDYHVYDNKTPQISDMERAETALGQVYEGEGQVEDDIKPSAEQTLSLEKKGIHSEMEESEFFLQTLQSDISAPLDSQPQQTDTDFNPIRNRRKLGSSRRNKGRQPAKDSYPGPTEEVVGNTTDNEPLETTKMSLTVETAVKEKFMETMLEGLDTFDTHPTEEVSDQVKQNAHLGILVGISEVTSSSLHSSLTEDQQIINPSNSTELPEDELPNVYSLTGKESKERDEHTELLRQGGNLQGNNLVSESHLKSEEIEYSTTTEIITEKSSHKELMQPEYNVDQAILSSQKEELITNEEQKFFCDLSEVKYAQNSEDVVNKVHEQEVKPTPMQEMHQTDYSFRSVIHNATGNSDTCSGNLIDQAEVTDTYQCELSVKSSDDSATNQEVLNPDNKQDEHHTRENDFEALGHTNEDYHVYDTKKPQISDTERVDTELGQLYESEGLVEDDIKPRAEQTTHQEKEEFLPEVKESESSLQSLQSETHAPLDSHLQDISVITEEQIHKGFNPTENRRKFGSSRRNKGRQQVKDSAAESYHEHEEEVVESTRTNEALETTQMLLAIEGQSQEELSQGSERDITMPATHESSLYSALMPGYSSEVQNPTTPNYPEADLESLILKCEKLQEEYDEGETDFKVELSDKSVGATLEEMDKSDTLQSQEVRGAHHSEDSINKIHEQEVKPTQMQEMPQIDYFSQSVTHDATERSEIMSGNLLDQSEVSDTYQSEMIGKSTDDSAFKQEDSNPGNKQDEHPIEKNNIETLHHRNENYHAYDTRTPQISDMEGVETALGQLYEGDGRVEDEIKTGAEQTVHQEKKGIHSEMEESKFVLQTLQSDISAPLDSQPQQTDTDFNPIRNRRKLGSSRRNKGRQPAKASVAESYCEPTEEVVGNTTDNDALAGILELTSSSLHSSSTVDQQLINPSNSTELPEDELPNAYSVTEKESKERHEHTELLRQDGNLLGNYLVSESGLKSEDIESSTRAEVTTEKSSPTEHTQPENRVDRSILASPKEELLTNEEQSEMFDLSKVKDAQHSEDVVNNVQEVKPTQMQEMHQTDYSFRSMIHNVTENSHTCSGNLIDQAEVTDTYQCELSVKTTDDSATNQEDSKPDIEDAHHTRENNFEALGHTNEGYHVYDTKKPQISDIERANTALGQLYESEGLVKGDIKPSAEQTIHQEKEEFLPEVKESESSLQSLQSETHAPLDSHLQDISVITEEQTHKGFNPTENRRKFGSSRRNKGRQQVKDSAAESYHEHEEEVVESTRTNEALETTQMLLAIEGQSQEELSQGSERDITMPATHESSLYSALMPGYSSEVQNPTTPNYPEADLESLILKCEKLQEEYDEGETDFKVELSDKSVGATLEEMDKSDTLQSQEVRGAHHSEDSINKIHEQEVKPTQMQEMPQIDYFSQSVTHDATERSEIMSGNLLDQSEVSDTYQSEMIGKSTDDSAFKQEDSNPGNKQDEHPIEKNNIETLHHRNENYHAYDTRTPQISDMEGVETALGQLYEGDGRVEDEIKTGAEQTVHQEKKGIHSEMEESKFVLQTLQSDISAPLDSQPQQTDTDFNPIRNRRKLGSSRRNKGRQPAKASVAESYCEPTEEVVGNTTDNDALAGILELTSSSLHSSSTVDQQLINPSNSTELPEDELPNAYSVTEKESKERHEHTELLRQDGNLLGNYLVSESGLKSEDIESSTRAEVTTEKSSPTEHTQPENRVDRSILASPKEELLTNEEQSEMFDLSKVKDAQHSEDVVNNVQEVKPTQMQEMHQTDYSFRSMIHNVTENSHTCSGNLIDQAEVTDTYQCELSVKTTDDSATNQEDSKPDKEDAHHTRENDFEALGHTNEGYHVYDTKKPQISDTERVDTALGQLYESEGLVKGDIKPSAEQTIHQEKEEFLPEVKESESSLQSLQSETHAPLDSQLLNISVITEEQTHKGFNPTENRRKFGSSRRNKGRQQVKDSAAESYHEHEEEVVESTRTNEALETTQMLLAIEGRSQEELSQGSERDITMPATHESSLYSALMPGYSSEVQNPTTTNYPEADLESSIPKSEKLQEDYEGGTDFKVEASDKSAGATLKGRDKSDTLECQKVRDAHHSEDAINRVHDQEVQEMHNAEISASLVSQPQQTDTDSNPIGNRRKLGSSRRNKGRQPAKDSVAESYHNSTKEVVGNTTDNEPLQTTKMSLTIETEVISSRTPEITIEKSSTEENSEEINSTLNDKENTEKMLEEDTLLSRNVLDHSIIVTTDMTSSSGNDDFVKSNKDNEKEKKLIEEPENLCQLTRYDTVKMDLIQSPKTETVGDFTIKNCNTGAESPMNVQVSGQDDVGEKYGDPTKKDHEAQEMNTLHEITHGEPFYGAHSNSETPFDIALKENFRAERAVDVSEESGICTTVTASNSQHGTQEREDLQGKSKQKRRKMGSTRRTQLSRKPDGGMDKDETKESDFNLEADMTNLDKIEVEKELPMVVTAEVSQDENAKTSQSPVDKKQKETNETSSFHIKGQKEQSSSSDLQSTQSNMVSDIDDLRVFCPEQSASHNEEVVNPVKFAQVTDVSSNDVDATEIGITGRSFVSLRETTPSTQNDEENTIQDQGLKSTEVPTVADFEIVKSVVRGGAGGEHENAQASVQELKDKDEGAHNKNLEMKNSSPNFNSTNRRRKMGSTRKNLGSRTKGEDLHQKQEVDNEATETATNVGDVKTECFSGIKEKELQLHIEHKDSDSEQSKEKVFETVKYSHTGESHFKPPALQTFEENPVSYGQLVETKHQLAHDDQPAIPSTSPKHDVLSESASGGRRRKMGSHRKSHGHQNNENQTARGDKISDTQNGRDVRSLTDERPIKTIEEESLGLDKTSEVDESNKKPSSNISTSKAGEHTMPKSEKTPERVTPVQHVYAEIRLGQESQKTIPLAGNSRRVDLGSNSYNVVMVGDSSVGKTSFLKRAQSGKFSLDIPASVGLDSCMWNVVVDGKPVVLQLWDTAGQERFHSITRQIFHKAQAFVLMYDISSSQSFSAISYWASCIQEGAAENVTILLLGNKSDHAKRQVTTQQGDVLAKEYNFEFMECSAATGENVIQSLETVARMLSQKADTREEAMVLHKEPQKRKSSGCC